MRLESVVSARGGVVIDISIVHEKSFLRKHRVLLKKMREKRFFWEVRFLLSIVAGQEKRCPRAQINLRITKSGYGINLDVEKKIKHTLLVTNEKTGVGAPASFDPLNSTSAAGQEVVTGITLQSDPLSVNKADVYNSKESTQNDY